MNRKKKEDIAYVVMILSALAGIMLMLWLLFIIIAPQVDLMERCEQAHGYMDRGFRCVKVIENY